MAVRGKVAVGVNGYGTIGRRVAWAAGLQPDMELVGVVKTKPDYAAAQAMSAGIPVYVPGEAEAERFRKAGLEVSGTIRDLLREVDVIVDATPDGVGATYSKLYREAGVKAIFQGGEEASVAQVSFSALCNYDEAVGKDSARVVSCNTTGLLRSICAINSAVGVRAVNAFLVRRAADMHEVKRGPINSVVLNPPRVPSHHAGDVRTVLPWLDITTAAVVVPTTLMHVHYVTMKLKGNASREEVLDALRSSPRVLVVSASKSGVEGTSQIIDAARHIRPRGDVPELVVFEESVLSKGDEVSFIQAVHQESIVVPENVDAIRALTGLSDGEQSVKLTNYALGIGKLPGLSL
ncbi:Glyceraldehyde-3-phosphate dehydrogenase (GAPDH) [Acidilobus saccharovorans 345-15]|uniref:Glyceraldehyde-3-phosphate dehydrogenase n=1 Tax=Acidilobus saccharovorans (strain DSM 16705 / JCM 18335 / VKM B-2471 / 345-15) TaxID=666510 RepID=D9Q1W0_ACIS3|nr:Glyceraldehyde-3-phosphate dehydrogenase (GAPDH) [Acidilobus saccharovorans 345-15]